MPSISDGGESGALHCKKETVRQSHGAARANVWVKEEIIKSRVKRVSISFENCLKERRKKKNNEIRSEAHKDPDNCCHQSSRKNAPRRKNETFSHASPKEGVVEVGLFN